MIFHALTRSLLLVCFSPYKSLLQVTYRDSDTHTIQCATVSLVSVALRKCTMNFIDRNASESSTNKSIARLPPPTPWRCYSFSRRSSSQKMHLRILFIETRARVAQTNRSLAFPPRHPGAICQL